MIREAAEGGDQDAAQAVEVLEQLKVIDLQRTRHLHPQVRRHSPRRRIFLLGMPIPGGYLYTSSEKIGLSSYCRSSKP